MKIKHDKTRPDNKNRLNINKIQKYMEYYILRINLYNVNWDWIFCLFVLIQRSMKLNFPWSFVERLNFVHTLPECDHPKYAEQSAHACHYVIGV